MSANPISPPAKSAHTALLAVLLLALVLAASAMRLVNLGKQSLWEDELFSADLVLQRPLLPAAGVPWLEERNLHDLRPGGGDSFWTVKAADQSPPMFELAAKLMTTLFGPGEIALRLTSALAAMTVAFWLALRAWFARAGPLLPVYLTVLVLTAFNGLMIFYGREARAYGLGAALTTVLAVRFWERSLAGWRQATLPGWGEIALCVAACMTHYNALALVGLMLLPAAWQGLRRHDWYALARLAVVAGVVALWLALSFDNFVNSASGDMGWHLTVEREEVPTILLTDFVKDAIGPWLAVLLLGLLLATGLGAAQRAIARNDMAAALWRATGSTALLLLVSTLVAIMVARSSMILNVRHLIFAMPVLFVLAGSCLALLAPRWPAVTWTFLLLAIAAQLPLAYEALKTPKSNFRAVTAHVTERLHDGDPLIVTPILNPDAYDYYVNRSGKHFRRELMSQDAQAQHFCELLAPYPRIGFLGHGSHLELAAAFKKACGERYNIDYIERYRAFGVVWTKK